MFVPVKYEPKGTWVPLTNFVNIQDEMDRLFNSYLAGTEPQNYSKGMWSPAVDVYEDNEKFVLKAELPGMNQADIKISLENNTISIKGERKENEEVKGGHYHKLERMSGSFARSFSLPTNVDGNKVSAHYKNGVLEIELPKSEERKSKLITINAD